MQVILNLSSNLRMVFNGKIILQEIKSIPWKENVYSSGCILINRRGLDGDLYDVPLEWNDVPENEGEIRNINHTSRLRFDKIEKRWILEKWIATHDNGAFAWLKQEFEFNAY